MDCCSRSTDNGNRSTLAQGFPAPKGCDQEFSSVSGGIVHKPTTVCGLLGCHHKITEGRSFRTDQNDSSNRSTVKKATSTSRDSIGLRNPDAAMDAEPTECDPAGDFRGNAQSKDFARVRVHGAAANGCRSGHQSLCGPAVETTGHAISSGKTNRPGRQRPAVGIVGGLVQGAFGAPGTVEKRAANSASGHNAGAKLPELAGNGKPQCFFCAADNYSARRTPADCGRKQGYSVRLLPLDAESGFRQLCGNGHALDERGHEVVPMVRRGRSAEESPEVSDEGRSQRNAARIRLGRLRVSGRTGHRRRIPQDVSSGSPGLLRVAATGQHQPGHVLGNCVAESHGFRLSVSGLVRGANKRQNRVALVRSYHRDAVPAAGRFAQSPWMAVVFSPQDEKEVKTSCEANTVAGSSAVKASRTHRNVSRAGSCSRLPFAEQQPVLVGRVSGDSIACRIGQRDSEGCEETRDSAESGPKEDCQFSQGLCLNVGRPLLRRSGQLFTAAQCIGREGLRDHSRALPEDISTSAADRSGTGNFTSLVNRKRIIRGNGERLGGSGCSFHARCHAAARSRFCSALL